MQLRVDAEELVNRRHDVTARHFVFYRETCMVVRLAVDVPLLDTAASEQREPALWPVVATRLDGALHDLIVHNVFQGTQAVATDSDEFNYLR